MHRRTVHQHPRAPVRRPEGGARQAHLSIAKVAQPRVVRRILLAIEGDFEASWRRFERGADLEDEIVDDMELAPARIGTRTEPDAPLGPHVHRPLGQWSVGEHGPSVHGEREAVGAHDELYREGGVGAKSLGVR